MAKPEIRLKGFKGEWEKMSFSEMVNRVATSGDTKTMPGVEFEDIISGEGVLNKDINNKKINKVGKCFEPGDVLFGKLRPYLKNILLADFKGVAIGDFWVLRPNKINSNLLYMLVSSNNFMKVANISSGSKMPRADWNLVFNSHFYIPKEKDEQKAISDYFKSLDSMILGVTKKISSLKQMKQACLVSMFPQAGETTPRVRFKGFKGEWQEKRLCDCLEISTERNFDNKYGKEDVLSVSDDFGVMNQIELLGRSYAGKSVSNYGILKTGEIVYTKSPLKSKPFGIVKQNTGKTGIVSVLYAVYIAKEGTAADYIHYYFDPDWRLNNYLRPLVNKGAKNTMNISDEMALTGYIMIPKDISEQQKIASYFCSLDKQISLQESRLEKLKQIKSASLDKMFV